MAERRATVALLLLLLAACASFGSRIEAPKVTVIGVRLDRLEQAYAFFGVLVELANPNATDVEITGLDATLAIEGEPVADASLAAPVRIPAGGTAQAELSARTGVDALLRAAAAAIRRGAVTPPGRAPSLHYSIQGAAIVGGGMRVPFSRDGELGSYDAK